MTHSPNDKTKRIKVLLLILREEDPDKFDMAMNILGYEKIK